MRKLAIQLFLSIPYFVFAQEKIDSSGWGKPKITGGINANTTFYAIQGIPPRRDPFYWLLSGNVTWSYNGIVVPFTVQFSQQQRSFTQPFNQFGASPRYKWLTLHGGYRSLFFSELTLAGTTFLGGGVEVTPENSWFRVIAMYGRLARPVNVGGVDGVVQGQPSFERWGYGTKCSFFMPRQTLDLIFFKAYDDPTSINPENAAAMGIKPQDNLVLGIGGSHKFTRIVSVGIEYAFSAFNPNILTEKTENAKGADLLFTNRIGTQYNGAFLGNIAFAFQKFQFKFNYRRIAPEYRTLGSSFLVNDLQDFSTGISSSLWKNKINYNLTGGLQNNNLDKSKETTTKRWIGSINANLNLNQHWNFTAAFANYTTTTQLSQFTQRSVYQQLNADSLYFLQVTQTASINVNYLLSGEKTKNTTTLALNYQKANDSKANNTLFYLVNASHTLSVLPIQTNFTLSYNYNQTQNPINAQLSTGPALSIMKTMLAKRLRVTFSANSLNTRQQKELANRSNSFRLNATYMPWPKHTFSTDWVILINQAFAANYKSFTEYRVGLNYGYTF